MDFSSFLTSLGTSFLIFVVLMLLFAWLSTKQGNAVVYYPNRILKGLEPWEGGSRTRNPLAWIKEAVSSSEQDVINMSGVDTAVYFVFLSTGFCLHLFVSFQFFTRVNLMYKCCFFSYCCHCRLRSVCVSFMRFSVGVVWFFFFMLIDLSARFVQPFCFKLE